MGVGEEGLGIRGEGERGNGIRVSFQLVQSFLRAEIPHADDVVDAAGVEFVARGSETDGRDGKVRVQEVQRGFLPRIPEPNVSVVAAACDELLATRADGDAVDDFLVARVAPDARAGGGVPARDVGVGGGGVDDGAVAREGEVEDGGSVAGEEARVGAGGDGGPEEDGAVGAGGGEERGGGGEAGGEYFGCVAYLILLVHGAIFGIHRSVTYRLVA